MIKREQAKADFTIERETRSSLFVSVLRQFWCNIYSRGSYFCAIAHEQRFADGGKIFRPTTSRSDLNESTLQFDVDF